MTAAHRTLMGALVGLARSLDGSNSSPEMLDVMLQALRAYESGGELDRHIQAVHDAKQRAVPDCSSCQNPCGRTFDYDLDELDRLDPPLADAKRRLILRIVAFAGAQRPDCDYAPVLAALCDALFAVGYDWFTPEQLDAKLGK